MSGHKTTKFPTYLAMTTDVILGSPTGDSKDYTHDIDVTIFDANDTAQQGSLKIWSRTCPAEGAYILNNAPFATDPLQIHVPDAINLRKIPEEFDGSDPENPTLTPSQPIICGLAIVKWVDDTKKTCILTGFNFMGKDKAWVLFKIRASFDDVPRFANWTVPAPRTMVTFDGIFSKVGEDGTIDCSLRRISQIDSAPPFLLSALDIGKNSAGDRAAKLREVRSKAGQRAKPEVKDDIFNETPKKTSAPENTSAPDAGSSKLTFPPVPQPQPSGIADAPPSSPTPAGPGRKQCLSPLPPLTTRKRARIEGSI
ncbi:hypothetical protein A4X13_0g7098 [Tilletia indica]|uniref:Uncharacterized protein n=1 Tax=Tilletia indica TaxID=43049 RepID=A0A177TMP7_9BASI|nr:hypothetical protein A4X13_0g7098 [Tilletia indica]